MTAFRRLAIPEVPYKVSPSWLSAGERAILWSAPDIGIERSDLGPVSITDKDRDVPRFADYDSPFVYEG